MRKFFVGLLVVAFAVGGAVAQAPAQFPTGPDIPLNIKPYFLALLMRTPQPQGAPEALPPELLAAHLAFIHKQVDAGKYVVVGPVLDHGPIGGIAVVQAATLEEAKTIANGDPMVAAGRTSIEVRPVMLVDLSAVKAIYPPSAK